MYKYNTRNVCKGTHQQPRKGTRKESVEGGGSGKERVVGELLGLIGELSKRSDLACVLRLSFAPCYSLFLHY